MSKHALLLLYRRTANWSWLHRCVRRCYLIGLLPLLRIIYRQLGAVDVLARHSARSGENFNAFLSDLDLTVLFRSNTRPIYLAHHRLKKFLPQLGEIEFHTPEEWALRRDAEARTSSALWQKTYAIRKIAWVSAKLTASRCEYEVTKNQRALQLLRNNLGVMSAEINGSDLFSDIIADQTDQQNLPATEHFCSFLEHPIRFSAQSTFGLYFDSPSEWQQFSLLLPDSPHIPEDLLLRQQKYHLVLRELLMAQASLRIHRHDADAFPEETIIAWTQHLSALLERLKS